MTAGSADAAARIIGLYEAHAQAWAEARAGSGIERGWLDRFAALLPPGAEVLDLGCGSGEPVGRYLAEAGFAVTGIDSSPSLVALCRQRLPKQDWIVADMRRLDLGRAFDGIIAWHSLFHLLPDEQRAMFGRLAAHARPDALLMFTSGHESGERLGQWQSEPLYHASLAPGEYEALLHRHGFALRERRLQDPDCGGASVWLAQMRPASGLEGSA